MTTSATCWRTAYLVMPMGTTKYRAAHYTQYLVSHNLTIYFYSYILYLNALINAYLLYDFIDPTRCSKRHSTCCSECYPAS